MKMDKTSGATRDRHRLEAVELIRTKADRTNSAARQPMEIEPQKDSPTIISGRQSLALGDRCIVYRNAASWQHDVTIIPFWSIDSFAVKTCRPKWILLSAISLFLASVLTRSGTLVFLGKQTITSLLGFSPPESQLLAWLPLMFLCLGIIALVAYLSSSATELVIYNHSGKNKVRLSLSPKLKGSVERLVEAIEAQMGRV
jgi:hypothetical protein